MSLKDKLITMLGGVTLEQYLDKQKDAKEYYGKIAQADYSARIANERADAWFRNFKQVRDIIEELCRSAPITSFRQEASLWVHFQDRETLHKVYITSDFVLISIFQKDKMVEMHRLYLPDSIASDLNRRITQTRENRLEIRLLNNIVSKETL